MTDTKTPTAADQLCALVDGLIRRNLPAMLEVQRSREDRTVTGSINLKLGVNGHNRPCVRAKLSFSDKTQDGVEAELDDPRQGKLTYEIKESR